MPTAFSNYGQNASQTRQHQRHRAGLRSYGRRRAGLEGSTSEIISTRAAGETQVPAAATRQCKDELMVAVPDIARSRRHRVQASTRIKETTYVDRLRVIDLSADRDTRERSDKDLANPNLRQVRNGSPRAPVKTCEIGKHTSELQSQSNLVCRLLLE